MEQKNLAVLAFVLVFAPFVIFISVSSSMPTGYFSVNINGPEISVNVSVTNDTANISWETDVSANATLNVSGEVEIFGFATDFIITLEDLAPDTIYSFDIMVCDNNSDCSTYEDSFTTESNPEEAANETNTTTDTTAPVVDIDVDIGVYSANVTWSTDESANATFSFNGLQDYFGFDTYFTKTLNDWIANTTYEGSIIFCYSDENCDS